MAGELSVKLYASDLTVGASLVPRNRNYVWNGSAWALWSAVSLATWRSALITCPELSLSSAEKTMRYVGDLPQSVAIPVTAIFYLDPTTALPSDKELGYQEINDLDLLVDTGLVVSDAGNTYTTFKTDLAGANAALYIDRLLLLNVGNGAREPRRITAFNTSTKFVTLAAALSAAPSAGDSFTILGYSDTN